MFVKRPWKLILYGTVTAALTGVEKAKQAVAKTTKGSTSNRSTDLHLLRKDSALLFRFSESPSVISLD